ncbi:MAG: S41 family peptidase [Oligoflexia bacterium]|nr:S41 family peptidase [Oligoflexia bacterium]
MVLISMMRSRAALLVWIVGLVFLPESYGRDRSSLEVYDRSAQIATENFYDRTFRCLPWERLVSDYRTKLSAHSTEAELKTTTNDLLAQLNASHTEFLSNSDQSYFALKSVFSGKLEEFPVHQIGAWFIRINGKWFVRNVFEGSPAAHAGLRAGDEVLAVDGRELDPVKSFQKGERTIVLSKRSTAPGPVQHLSIQTEFASFHASLHRATLQSLKLIRHKGKRIAYFHLWAGTHAKFQEALKAAATEMASQSDAFILDLRDGFGGAHPGYVEPFFARDEEGQEIPQIYSKPLIVLINGGVRSGKEWVAHVLKLSKRGILVGTRTAGYFLAGKLFDIQPGKYLLYLAVALGPEGVDLEGKGVLPDVEVQAPLPYSAGADPQLAEALNMAVQLSESR